MSGPVKKPKLTLGEEDQHDDFGGPPIHKDPFRDPDEVTIAAPKKLDKMSSMLTFLKQHGGSDLHVSANNRAMIRIRGQMRSIDYKVTDQDVREIITPYMNKTRMEEFERNHTVDFSFRSEGIGVFRVNVFRQRFGMAFVLRYLAEKAPTLDELNLPSIIRRSCYTDNGLILVTGPTGSGKSTTLAAMINEINDHRPGHIITLEDPIEYLHESKKCMVNQREMGAHFVDFASSIRSCLREDPDVILVGEMRDRETIKTAIQAAETGHLVLSTLHTGSAAKTIDRILNSFPSDEQDELRTVLAETLRVVVSQKLIPNKARTNLRLFQDILVNNRAVANLIREGRTFLIENAMQTSHDEGMMLMDRSIKIAAEEGMIRMADAHEVVNDKRIIEESAAFLRDEYGIVETVDKLSRDNYGDGEDERRRGEDRRKGSRDPSARPSEERSKEVIGIQHIIAELKPGFRAEARPSDKKDDAKGPPIHIKKIGDK